jgi:hypothetical protein
MKRIFAFFVFRTTCKKPSVYVKTTTGQAERRRFNDCIDFELNDQSKQTGKRVTGTILAVISTEQSERRDLSLCLEV